MKAERNVTKPLLDWVSKSQKWVENANQTQLKPIIWYTSWYFSRGGVKNFTPPPLQNPYLRPCAESSHVYFFNIELLLWPLLLRLKQTLLLKLKESLVTMAYVMKSSVLKHGVCGHTSTLQDAHYFGKIPTQMLIGTQPTQADIRQGSTKYVCIKCLIFHISFMSDK